MLEYDVAVARTLELGRELGRAATRACTEVVPVSAAYGRILAEDVRALWPFPARDYSAMDGYAVATSDLEGQSFPVRLPVSGESRAGSVPRVLEAKTACRIFTGGTVPEGADAIVMQENVRAEGGMAEFAAAPRPSDHIRRAGEDLAAGALALGAGSRIHGPAQSLLAMVERREVSVAVRPRLGILCTGDELREPVGQAGGELPLGLAESNSYSILSICEKWGARGRVLPHVVDEKEPLRAALEQASRELDVLVTVGGASVGDHDLVKPLLLELGADIRVPKVNIKPGKPVFLARLGECAVLGLPGNPSSAVVTFALFGLPLLGAWLGETSPGLPEVEARLATPYKQKSGRRSFVRGYWDQQGVHILDNQASGAGTTLAKANVYVHLEPDVTELVAGDPVRVIPLWGL